MPTGTTKTYAEAIIVYGILNIKNLVGNGSFAKAPTSLVVCDVSRILLCMSSVLEY